MAVKDLSDPHRYDRILAGPSLPVYSITKSSQYQPGQIFTAELDYKTRFYATFHIDSADTSSPTLRGKHYSSQNHQLDPVPQSFIPASCQEYRLDEQSFPLPAQSDNRFHNVIPIKTVKQDTKGQRTKNKNKNNPLELADETAMPVHKPSTNFLRGTVLKPSPHSKVFSSTPDTSTTAPGNWRDGSRVSHSGGHGLYPSSSNLSQRPPSNFHPRVPPPVAHAPSTPTSTVPRGISSPHRSSSHSRPSSPPILVPSPAPPRRAPPAHSATGSAVSADDDTLPSASLVSASSSLTSLPPHIIHSRLMGWKLTSPERRKELIQLFEDVRHQGAEGGGGGGEEERELSEEILEERKRVMKRQTEAYKATVNRQSVKMKNKMKYSLHSLGSLQQQQQQTKRGVVAGARVEGSSSEYPLALPSHEAATRYRNNHASPALTSSTDPFQALIEKKKQKEMAMNRALSNDALSHIHATAAAASGNGLDAEALESLSSKWGFSAATSGFGSGTGLLMKPVLPEYQTKARDPKLLFEHPDRMELLDSAASIEKAASRTISSNLEKQAGAAASSAQRSRGQRLPQTLGAEGEEQKEREQKEREQKLSKAVSEPFLRELSVRSANRKKRELAEERKELLLQGDKDKEKGGIGEKEFVSVPMVRPATAEEEEAGGTL
jgi:hypothetical protein